MSKLRIFPKAQHALQAMKLSGKFVFVPPMMTALALSASAIAGEGPLLMPHMAGARQHGTGWGLKSSPIWSAGLAVNL